MLFLYRRDLLFPESSWLQIWSGHGTVPAPKIYTGSRLTHNVNVSSYLGVLVRMFIQIFMESQP